MPSRPPIGSCWRILVQQPQIDAASGNYTALAKGEQEFEAGNIFDELVIVFDPDPREAGPPYKQQNATCLHLEQMNERDWYLGIGDLKFNLHIREDTGALELTLYDGEQTKFSDNHSKRNRRNPPSDRPRTEGHEVRSNGGGYRQQQQSATHARRLTWRVSPHSLDSRCNDDCNA